MLAQINERLAEYKLIARYQHNGNERLRQIQLEIEEAKYKVKTLQQQLYKEEQDVERLGKLTLGTMLLTLLGGKQKRLTREEEEALVAKLRLEEAEDTLRDLEGEKVEQIAKLADIGQADRQYELLLEDKRNLIMTDYPELAEQLENLTEQESALSANCKELDEAQRLGNSVVSELERASGLLESAGNWGTFDLLGGGALVTMAKHQRIDDARVAIHVAQEGLRRFAEELKDVNRDVQVEIDIGGRLTFADFFFDGLIADWIVQGRIQTSQRQMLDKLHQVRSIVHKVARKTEDAHAELRLVQRKIGALIENSA
ncbi:hypothetical protein EBB07_26110 [Paenibacillaceae bacterium]|nr:hypothetical protein EBB07_26110 [Paenibacillaceae bacterium]